MRSSELKTFDPFEKDSLIQPNKVTNASYSYTPIEENVLTCIMGAIQGHLTQERSIQTDLFGSPIIRIKAEQVASGRNKTTVLDHLEKLMKKDIRYSYTDNEGSKKVTTSLISGFTNLSGSDFIDVHLAAYSIPYLIYWGKGVGGTTFSKTLALTLSGMYTKRIYKLLKQWEDKGGIPPIDIEDFKHKFKLPKSYRSKSHLEEKVFNPAKKELDKHGDITFDYTITKIKSRSFNTINIKIFSGKSAKAQENTNEWYRFVYRFLCRVYPNYESDRAQRIADQLQESGKIRSAYEKFGRLEDEFTAGKKDHIDLKKLTIHILREDFGVTTKGRK